MGNPVIGRAVIRDIGFIGFNLVHRAVQDNRRRKDFMGEINDMAAIAATGGLKALGKGMANAAGPVMP